MNRPPQLDTAPIVATIRHLLADGTEGPAFLAAVVRRFPNLTSAELSAALQDAQAAEERRYGGSRA